jgi:UDP-N-acetylglucosamine 4,6-dehydratase/UDP-glucose 4-epimerase
MNNIEKGKTYLVTGGSGFLGKCLIERILKAGGNVKTIARDEGKLIELKQLYPNIEIVTGDIADPFDMQQALKNINAVFHLAAFKHVGIAEDQPRECVKSNLIGSLNLLELTANMKLDYIMMISTDKTAKISGVYGASKFLMERLTHQFENNYPHHSYRIVRYGNVLYSTGSVLCKWKDLLQNNKEIIITNPEATRFYWTVEQAVDLIFDCLLNATDSQPYVPEMKSIRMGDLLTAMAEKYLPNDGTLKIKQIGMQPGENLHEKVLIDGISSKDAEKFTIEEIKEMI